MSYQVIIEKLRSACCDAELLTGCMCGDCKEHCDVYCSTCGTEYENGTESCKYCSSRDFDIHDILGRADKE